MDTLVDFIPLFEGHNEAPAVVYRTGVRRLLYSYGDIHTLILRMNRLLADAGVRKGDRVILWAPNSPWWLVTFWGVMARGAVLVPVDFMSGRERAETIAALTEPQLVIQSTAKAEQVAGYRSLIIETLEFNLLHYAPFVELAPTVPDDCAEIVYTSGTTGNPKGVVLSHRNLIANLQQVNGHLPIVSNEFTFLSLLPLSHMFEQMGGFLTPLSHGATIVFLRTLKPSAIMEALAEEDIYAVVAVPRLLALLKGAIEERFRRLGVLSLFTKLLNYAETMPAGIRRMLFAPIRWRFGNNFTLFVSGGAALAADVFRFWSTLGFTVVEGYGLTECSPVLTANTMTRQVAGAVGGALPGVELRLVAGEVQVSGANVFSGYYQNSSATVEAFTPDGWFRTGDLGEIDDDGILRLKGRAKELIVTGAGINVYPDEIEELLNREPGVKDSCVIGLDRGSGDEVYAVLLLVPGGSAEQAVAAANARLDDLHRITGYTVWADEDFPRTTTLKIRKFMVRQRLSSRNVPVVAGLDSDRIVSLIARVTGSPANEIKEDSRLVNDLGLTSIGRLELVNAIEEEFRLDLDESIINPGTRVSDLRELVAKRKGRGRELHYRRWVASPVLDVVRAMVDLAFHRILLAPFVTLSAEGLENFAGIKQPMIFIANHVSYLDQPAVAHALPLDRRRNLATAAWAEFFFSEFRTIVGRIWKRFTYEYGTVFLHLFPLPQSTGFRGALRHMGYLVDHGYSILVFPEGARSADGGLLPFQQGLGIVVAELRLPVVPVAIMGMEHVLPRGAGFPRRGKINVRFGAPLSFAGESRDEIVAVARRAVEELMNVQ